MEENRFSISKVRGIQTFYQNNLTLVTDVVEILSEIAISTQVCS